LIATYLEATYVVRKGVLLQESTQGDWLDRYAEVLTYLAKFGPATKYGIENGLRPPNFSRIDHATLYKIASQLKELDLIKVVKTGKSRVGMRMEYYDPTLFGLIGAIQYDSEVSRASNRKRLLELNGLAEKYGSDLPLIFGKWRFFAEMGWDPDEWFLNSSCRFVNWKRWAQFMAQLPKRGDPAKMFRPDEQQIEFFHLMIPYTFGRDWDFVEGMRGKVPSWQDVVRNGLYFGFFNIPVPEVMWVQPTRTKRPFFDKEEANTSRLDTIWAKDWEIYHWITEAVTVVAGMYSERVQWFEKRKKRLEALKSQ